MNGIHDMGGMHGMGRIDIEADEPVFHEEWEGRMFAMNVAMGAWEKWSIDASRQTRERMDPADSLRASYYELWLWALESLLVEHGFIRRDELDARQAELARQEGGT